MNVSIDKAADGLVLVDASGTVLARAAQLPGEYSIDLRAYAAAQGWTVIEN